MKRGLRSMCKKFRQKIGIPPFLIPHLIQINLILYFILNYKNHIIDAYFR